MYQWCQSSVGCINLQHNSLLRVKEKLRAVLDTAAASNDEEKERYRDHVDDNKIHEELYRVLQKLLILWRIKTLVKSYCFPIFLRY